MDSGRPSRRAVLKAAGTAGVTGVGAIVAGGLGALACPGLAAGQTPAATTQPAAGPGVGVRAITRGPKHHWFGYYDKLQVDPTGRYVLGMEVDFEHRSPKADDTIAVGMVDLGDHDRWIELGRTRAWCWQQGCMLQWRPGSPSEIVYNDRQGEDFCCHVLDVKTGRRRTLPGPIYTLSPDGLWAVTPDFRRIQHLRPGYGYAGLADPNRDKIAPDDSGIWRMDMRTGKRELILTIAQIAAIPSRVKADPASRHWFNHLLYSPSGQRFIFLHRWQKPRGSFDTRMFTASAEGKDLHVVDDYGGMSHFIWRDPEHILAWASRPPAGGGFYLYTDRSDRVEQVGKGVMTQNGHCTYLPGNQWILNDTYPTGKARLQTPYLYHVPTGRKVVLGQFASPPAYTGEWRCDLHPRSSPDGRAVTIDSPHGGQGRQIYRLDIGGVLDAV